MSTLPKDEKTLEALEKIKAILREYDLWAGIVVVSKERAHWLYHVDSSWSCVSISPATGEVRVRAKVADFKSKKQHADVVKKTAGAVLATRDFGLQQSRDFNLLVELLRKNVEFTNEYSDQQIHDK